MMQGKFPTISDVQKTDGVCSTRAIFDGTPGQKPRIEFVENLSTFPARRVYFIV